MSLITEKIEKFDIEALPIGGFDGPIAVTDDISVAHDMMTEIVNMCKVVGFDTETRPNFQRGEHHKVALLQVCDGNKAWLFRLCNIGLTPEIQSFFANPNILKVGLSLGDDIRALRQRGYIEPQNIIDVQNVAKEYGIPDASLAKLAARTLGIKISKRQRVSNWAAPTLTSAQIHYAATDAWVTLQIYNELKQGNLMLPHIENLVRLRLAEASKPTTE